MHQTAVTLGLQRWDGVSPVWHSKCLLARSERKEAARTQVMDGPQPSGDFSRRLSQVPEDSKALFSDARPTAMRCHSDHSWQVPGPELSLHKHRLCPEPVLRDQDGAPFSDGAGRRPRRSQRPPTAGREARV